MKLYWKVSTKWIYFSIIFLVLVVPAALIFAKGYISLSIRHYKIVAETAKTPIEWGQGLMHRKSLPKNHGMLFIFKNSQTRSFWMKNTLIPLDIAFLNEKGKILTEKTMKAMSTDLVSSEKPFRYALEMNAGLLKKIHARPGDQVLGVPGTK